ncbi:MAG: VIT and VWA domain-containing protein [Xanthomonadales bacterium]|jgi:Ca-activated chloride channel family protein|nr:VIT and VWA domain-containing protein [Xanthomonadales bacterium]
MKSLKSLQSLQSLKSLKPLLIVPLALLALASGSAQAAGLLQPVDRSVPALEIREHHVRVVVEDGYAITRVDQVFANPNDLDLEAIYSFPVPERAAVSEFTVWIDGQPVSGEVFEKERARELYEEERQAGRDAGLAEQDDYRTFDIAVQPVRAKQDVRVRLAYLQPVTVDTSIGRYVYPLEDGGVDEERLSFWSYDEAVRERFSFEMAFRSSWPIDTFRLPGHPQAVIEQLSDQEWRVSLAADAGSAATDPAATDSTPDDPETTKQAPAPGGQAPAFRLDQDIVVYWRQADGLPAAVELVAHKPDPAGQGTFLMTVTPGNDLAPIVEGRDWVFVLDLSGSMAGKYHSLVEGLRRGLDRLPPGDRFRVVLFNDRAWALTSAFLPVDAANVERVMRRLGETAPDNGTNLYAGLSLGLDSLESDRSSALILVTDGVANVGVTEKRDFRDLLTSHDVRLFTFIMGNSANRPLLQGMADLSGGFAMNLSNGDDMAGKILEASSRLTHESLHDIVVEIDGVKVRDMTRSPAGSLYRGQQLMVMGHYWGDGPADVTVRGKISGEPRVWRTRFDFPHSATLNPELERLWAFAAIDELQQSLDYLGEGPDLRQAIVDLAVDHGLVTPHTSMLVLTEERFTELGIERNNRDRLAQEAIAAQARAAQAVRSHRVDGQQPISSRPRASHGNGGGNMGLGALLLLALLGYRAFAGGRVPRGA